MVELAEIFLRHGTQYRAKFKERMLTSHLVAMHDIEQCRTETFGGHVYACKDCGEVRFSYHSCKNRHCPKCQNKEATRWLELQVELLLPVTYFLVTFTLPEELRQVARSHQRIVYGILFRTSAAALKKLALDPKYLGGHIGMVGVLQTWSKGLSFHPHIHYIVPSGGLSPDGTKWIPTRCRDYLVNVKALSKIFRAKFRDEIKKAALFDKVPPQVWKKDWVSHSQPVGTGREAIKYLVPYVYRVAISNKRIEKLENGQVTFRYKRNSSDHWERSTLEAEEFIRRFLQHVLPRSFIKIRYYGFMSSTNRALLDQAKGLFQTAVKSKDDGTKQQRQHHQPNLKKALHCPTCGGLIIVLFELPWRKRAPP